MSTVRKDGEEEEQREWTTSPALGGSNTAIAL